MKQKNRIFCTLLTLSFLGNFFPTEANEMPLYTVQFQEIPMAEFIRFVGKIAKVNFIFNKEELGFNVSFSSTQETTPEVLVRSLIRLLQVHHFHTLKEDGYFVIHKGDPQDGSHFNWDPGSLTVSADDEFIGGRAKSSAMTVYKLQYHEGSEIVDALKKMASDIGSGGMMSPQVSQAIQTLQWVKMTNSLIFSGDERTIRDVNQIISSLDTPLRQVFIEVLVIETDVKKGLDFGLQWAVSGKYDNRLAGGFGNFAPQTTGGPNASFVDLMKGVNANNLPGGLSQIPIVPGFDLGMIGDIITHRGTSYLSLGSLVSALQLDTDSTIVLNQKIITQDNKNSRIFVGDNIPFTGSVVTTVGQSQQTTANIEYRDVGVSLNITPMLGDGGVISLSLDQEISEAVYEHEPQQNVVVNGIRTTKTNMLTHVHVPDKHFLVLSGMIRNAKATHKTGIPCLGALPVVGALFSRTRRQDEKRNVIIFVRPQIIHSFHEYKKITENQEKVYERQCNEADFKAGLDLLPPPD